MRTSIFLKIFFTFLLVTLLPILGLIAYNDWKDKDILIQANKNTIKGDAERVASNIDDLLLSHKTLICNLRNNCKLVDYLKENRISKQKIKNCAVQCLNTLKNLSPYYEGIIILDKEGKEKLSTANAFKYDFPQRDVFKEALKGNVYISEPSMDNNKSYIYYSAPVKDVNDNIIAVLVLATDAKWLYSIIEKEKDRLGKGVVCVLSDKHGVRIAHASDRNLLFKSWVPLPTIVKRELTSKRTYGEHITEIWSTDYQEVADTLKNTGENIYFKHRLFINPEINHGFCVTLKQKDWKLIYTMPQSTFFYFVNRITMHAILTTIAVVILLFFISWIVTKSLLRPIYKLKNAAVKISKGEFDYPVKTSRKDELGKLVLLFDDMRKQLQSMNNTLKEIHVETIYTLIKICRGFEKEELVMHLLRTSEYSTVIAKHMGLDTAFIDTIRYSSLLHDIGLVAVPQYIREKATLLTLEELEILKSHTIYGEQFLSKKPIFQMARDIALYHHENWDGTGYPDGIKNGNIPLAARIVRIADIFDNLTYPTDTCRPELINTYKPCASKSDALNIIQRYSGIHFDPSITGIFKQLVESNLIGNSTSRHAAEN
ncbi:MAG: HD domain-containing protein [Planctomycetes bacterium]|nr:HD domain-containing protein [Planctomycetota bacterium]